MKRPKQLLYKSQAHAQIDNGPIKSQAEADERQAKAITNLYRAVLGDAAKRRPKYKRTKPKGKP